MIWFIHRAEPQLRYGLRRPSRVLVRRVASFSSALFFLNAAERVHTKTDEFVIGGFLPVAAVAPYSVARRLAELPQLLTLQFVNLLLPLASQLDAEDDRHRLRTLYLTGTRIALVTYLPIAVGLMVLAHPFIAAWVGTGYAHASIVVVILGFAGLLAMLAWPGNLMLQGMARHRVLTAYAVPAAILNIGLSIALIHPLGVKGVALATLVALGLQSCFFLARATRVIELSFRELVRKALAPAALPAIPMVATLFALRALVDPHSLLGVVFVGGTGGAVYLATYLWVGASPSERELAQRLAVATSRRSPSTRV
jgi:O-antigen/teichoic acid export membrane protein